MEPEGSDPYEVILYGYKKAGQRLQKRIKNLVDDLHIKLSSWLCKDYDTILLPEFETQKMAL